MTHFQDMMRRAIDSANQEYEEMHKHCNDRIAALAAQLAEVTSKNAGNFEAAARYHDALCSVERERDTLRAALKQCADALQSIALNSCCAPCREAGRVATKALANPVVQAVLQA